MDPLEYLDQLVNDPPMDERVSHVLCPDCAGAGCERCNASGFVPEHTLSERERYEVETLAEEAAAWDVGHYMAGDSPFEEVPLVADAALEETDDPVSFLDDEEPPVGVSS